jgi:ABC-type sugar transport system substrate-binding protein
VSKALQAAGWDVEAESGAPGRESKLTALVIGTAGKNADDRTLRQQWSAEARQRNLPLFLVGPQPGEDDPGDWEAAVGPLPYEEGHRAGRWLGQSGLSAIWEVREDSGSEGADRRSQGLADALADREQTLAGSRITDGTRAGTARLLEAVWAGQRVDGVLASSDEIALGVIDALKALGMTGVKVVAVGGGPDVAREYSRGTIAAVVQRSDDLGGLLVTELRQALTEPGVSRRLVTSHDLLAR